MALDRAGANYLLNVLRLKSGDDVLVFNGRDGEWRARMAEAGRKAADLEMMERTRPQTQPADLLYCFAPLKRRVSTTWSRRRSRWGRAAEARVHAPHAGRAGQPGTMRANAIEAAEQCGILSIPAVEPDEIFQRRLRSLEPERLVVFCDEDAPVASPTAALGQAGPPRKSSP